MENAGAIGSSRNHYRMTRNAGQYNPSLSELVREFEGLLTHIREYADNVVLPNEDASKSQSSPGRLNDGPIEA